MAFKYSGDLTKPMAAQHVSDSLMPEDQVAKVLAAVAQEKAKRMALLFDAHSVNHGNWKDLCYALAEAHVPGLKMAAKKAGRPKKWDNIQRAELVLAVEAMGGGDVQEAVKRLFAVDPWRSLAMASRGAETLRDEYYRADQIWVQLLRKAKAFDALTKQEKERARNSSD